MPGSATVDFTPLVSIALTAIVALGVLLLLGGVAFVAERLPRIAALVRRRREKGAALAASRREGPRA